RFSIEFEVNRILGAGGFGIVFEGINVIDNCRYAVKRVSVKSSHIDKALREVRTMALLDHPGIVRYNNTWIEKPPAGWQYEFDMELFKKRIYLHSNAGECDFDASIKIFIQICKKSLAE
ncbi:hypothetical protein PENTCL1PPCAC_20657, partial [Pristionchus entomophagus]